MCCRILFIFTDVQLPGDIRSDFMEERVHATMVGLLLCCEDILDPGIHQQHHELHTQYSTAFLLLVLFSVISAWRHIQIQFIFMGLPRPVQVILDAETGISGSSQENDLPPKYEDVAEIPPKYEEATMKPTNR